jgi:hypothetical protein
MNGDDENASLARALGGIHLAIALLDFVALSELDPEK